MCQVMRASPATEGRRMMEHGQGLRKHWAGVGGGVVSVFPSSNVLIMLRGSMGSQRRGAGAVEAEGVSCVLETKKRWSKKCILNVRQGMRKLRKNIIFCGKCEM